jgi:hypothetical protein
MTTQRTGLGEAVRVSIRWMLLAAALAFGAVAALFGAIALAALTTANLLAKHPETEYHLRLRVNPDPAPTREELGELADMDADDRRTIFRWVRAYKKGLGE